MPPNGRLNRAALQAVANNGLETEDTGLETTPEHRNLVKVRKTPSWPRSWANFLSLVL